MQHLHPTDYRSMPWKNGGGTTIEMVVYPPQAGLDDFVWRVSQAQVAVNGGFSHFEGIDRTLAVLQGQGVLLHGAQSTLTLNQDHPMAVFAGDVAITAELIDGPISDLNVMSRRGRCCHQLTHWRGAVIHTLPANTALIFCAQGDLQLDFGSSSLTVLAEESLLFDSTEPVTEYVVRSSADSQVYCIQIYDKDHS